MNRGWSPRPRLIRASGEFEYLLARDYCDRFRPGVGFRIEDISDSDPRYIFSVCSPVAAKSKP